jgi:arylsulfatase A-like enzyme
MAATTSNSPTEFVDVFPTICDLAGVKIPDVVDGKSLKPLMDKTAQSVKEFSISQYPRSGTKSETERQGYASSKVMGYSLRDKRYRYTIWLGNDFRSTQAFDDKLVVGIELYDYDKETNETANLANDIAYQSVASDLKAKMLDFFKSQLK